MNRSTYLPFALPDLDESELEEIRSVIESGWVTTGPKTREFERRFADAVGAKHAVAVNSCTAALHLALEAIGVRRGDEVITTAYTFAATAEVIRYFDATPVFVDVDPLTLNIDPSGVERALGPRTRAVIPVHVAGLPADLDSINAAVAARRVPIIDDAAHAFPAERKGMRIGGICDMTCFSFYATKTLTTGEGGMISTSNDAWADRCRIMSLHGISRDAWKRYTSEGSWYYEIIAPGYKYNMTDIAAAMGLAQLAKAESMRQKREHIAKRYTEVFSNLPELQPPTSCPDCTHAWHLYMLRLNLDQFTIDRAQIIEELKRRNIGVSVHFIPLHMHPYYRDSLGLRPSDLPVAHHEYLREISLPIYSKMSDQDVSDVVVAVADIVQAFRR